MSCLENVHLLHISLKNTRKLQKHILEKGPSFHNYCINVICTVASPKFALQSEVTFREMSNLNVF